MSLGFVYSSSALATGPQTNSVGTVDFTALSKDGKDGYDKIDRMLVECVCVWCTAAARNPASDFLRSLMDSTPHFDRREPDMREPDMCEPDMCAYLDCKLFTENSSEDNDTRVVPSVIAGVHPS